MFLRAALGRDAENSGARGLGRGRPASYYVLAEPAGGEGSWVSGCLALWLAVWLADCMEGKLGGWVGGWRTGWLDVKLAGRKVGSLKGKLVTPFLYHYLTPFIH